MALKSYHPETLNDNWFEERAEPLNGVLPHDGMKEYATTTKADFAGAKPLVLRSKPRIVNERSLGQALLQSAGANISHGFRSSLPRPNEEEERRYLETTHRAAFGSPSPQSSFQREAHRGVAGGVGGRPNERGKSTSGSMGEVFKTNSEPQKDTASQRSWLYSMDPMIATKLAGAPSNNSPDEEKITDGSQPIHQNFRRKSTSITTVPLSHKGVFADD